MKTEPFEYEIAVATEKDIDELVKTALEFWQESRRGQFGEADSEKYAAFLKAEMINTDCRRVIIAKLPNGRVVGYHVIYAQADYKQAMDGEMYQFFVHPAYRGSGIARELVAMAVQTWDDWGCDTIYACAAPEVGNMELSQFRNLWAKFGFEETGIIMTRRKDAEHGR